MKLGAKYANVLSIIFCYSRSNFLVKVLFFNLSHAIVFPTTFGYFDQIFSVPFILRRTLSSIDPRKPVYGNFNVKKQVCMCSEYYYNSICFLFQKVEKQLSNKGETDQFCQLMLEYYNYLT